MVYSTSTKIDYCSGKPSWKNAKFEKLGMFGGPLLSKEEVLGKRKSAFYRPRFALSNIIKISALSLLRAEKNKSEKRHFFRFWLISPLDGKIAPGWRLSGSSSESALPTYVKSYLTYPANSRENRAGTLTIEAVPVLSPFHTLSRFSSGTASIVKVPARFLRNLRGKSRNFLCRWVGLTLRISKIIFTPGRSFHLKEIWAKNGKKCLFSDLFFSAPSI